MLSTKDIELLKAKWWPINEYAKECDRYENAFDGLTHRNIIGFFFVILFGISSAAISLVFKFMRVKSEKRIIRALSFEEMLSIGRAPAFRLIAQKQMSLKERKRISVEMGNRISLQQKRRCNTS